MKEIKNKNFFKILLIIIGLIIFIIFIIILYFQSIQHKKVQTESPTPEWSLDQLTPKDIQPLSSEEKKEIDIILEEITPVKPEEKTSEEQEDLKRLLNELTP